MANIHFSARRAPFSAARPFRILALGVATLVISTASHAAGFSVLEINSPGPAISMSDNGNVAGYFVAKCATLSSQPKRTICYNAPWVFENGHVTKLTSKFPSNANASAVAINNAGDVIGADLTGAWYYSQGQVAYVDAANPNLRGSRLMALNNGGLAVGMSYVSSVYGAITYRFNGIATPALAPGYANDINDAGMITGWFRNAANVEQGFVVDATGVVTSVPSLDPSINCRTQRISQVNPNGSVWVVGNCAGNRPFRYEVRSNTLTELTYAGSSNLSAVSINSWGDTAGTAVRPGAYAPDGYTALLWSANPAAPMDLNANNTFAPAGAWNVHATDISESGTVLTGYNDTSGNFFTFLLRPIP